MTGKLYFTHDGVRGMSLNHDDVRNQLSQLIGSAPDGSVIGSTHGLIASPMTSELNKTIPSREAVLGITQAASEKFSKLLSTTLQLYELGDTEAAARLRAATEALDGQQGGQGGQGGPGGGDGSTTGAQSSDGSAGTSSDSSGSGGSGSGSDTASQMVSQVGQQVGQLGQTLAQSVQGLAQIPGQIMQGVQGIVQAAVGAGGTGGSFDDKAEQDGKGEADDKARPGGKGEGEPDDKAQPGSKGEGGPAPRDRAEPGSTGHGKAPDVPVQRGVPTQTRPQQSPL